MLIGGSVFDWVEQTEPLRLLGEIGVMLLLFEIGLESDLQSFLKVGWSAAAVATIGVVTPFVLGYGLALALHMTNWGLTPAFNQEQGAPVSRKSHS